MSFRPVGELHHGRQRPGLRVCGRQGENFVADNLFFREG